MHPMVEISKNHRIVKMMLKSSRDSHSIITIVVDQSIVDSISIATHERESIPRIVEELAIVERNT